MKKVISFLLILSFTWIMLLTGCGNSSQDESSSSARVEQSPSSGSTLAVKPEDSEADANGSEEPGEPSSGETTESQITGEEENTEMKMNVQVGNAFTFTATLEDNAAADAFVEMMESAPVTIRMRDYSGFEKVGPIGAGLPTIDSQTTTQAGDIVLYQGNQIVVFYGSNSWSYTRLGHIDDLTGWEEALGSGDVTVTFSLEG